MLEVSDLHAHYGRAHILQGVTLSAAKGELLTLLGRNGAGKSTTMKAIMGLVRPSAGHVRFEGVELRGTAHLHRTDRGREPGGRPPSRPPPSGGWTAERIYALFPNLAAMRARPGERMSGGEQQLLTIGRSLMGNPRLILLDESIEGLAPVIIERMADAILALKRDGMTVLLSEQNLHFARLVSDRACVLEKGEIRWQGSMAALMAAEDVRADYLTIQRMRDFR